MRDVARIVGLILLLAGAARAEVGGYVEEIGRWHDKFDQGVRDDGWLTLVARERIDEGRWTLGSEPRSAIVLPAKAPPRLGLLSRRGTAFRFSPASKVAATLGGRAIKGAVDLPTRHGSDSLESGDLSLVVRAVGEDFYLLVSDSKNGAVHEFLGTTWYPVDPAFHVAATFEPYDKPETVHVPLTHVDSREVMQSTGDLVFQLAGKSYRLKTFLEDEGLFVMFQDATNGQRTYGGGRFIDVPKPVGNVTTLDFNKAFNPYCSLNAYIMCPIPPAENRLDLAVTAGETYFPR
jgi:uncharacterized protein (DUF1684 family)